MDVKTIVQSEISLHHVSGLISPTFWSETYHAHDHAEIFIHIRGQMQLFIENNIYYHSGNEIRVYAPQEYHFGKSDTTQEMEWYQISLAPSFLKAYPALANKIINRPKGRENVFISRKHETIVSLMEEIYKKQSSPIGEHYLFANILKVLCLLNETENNIEVKMGKNECLQSIIETIHNHLPQIKTVETIAQLTHFSPSYIHQLFKKYLNITPHKYILTKSSPMQRNFYPKELLYHKPVFVQALTITQTLSQNLENTLVLPQKITKRLIIEFSYLIFTE